MYQNSLRTNGNTDIYVNEIRALSLISRSEENELIRKAQKGDRAARDKVVNSNMRFVASVARTFGATGIMSYEDIISEGAIGLMTAIDKFDPNKGYHFISYAVWWIRQSIMKALSEKSRVIKLPLNRSNDYLRIQKAENDLMSANSSCYVSDEDIAEVTGLRTDIVRDLRTITKESLIFDAPINSDEEGGAKIGDLYESSEKRPEAYAVDESMNYDVHDLLSVLTDKEADIIRKRFGLDGYEALSLRKIGNQYNLTKERIRQIEKGAMDKMRKKAISSDMAVYLTA